MTTDLTMGILRWVLAFVTGIVVGKGWLTSAQAAEMTTLIMQIATPLLAVIGIAWTAKANSKTSIIKSASAMPEMDSKKLVAAISDPDLKQAAASASTPQKKDSAP